MTDKPIIIDGVDVSECINYRGDVFTDKQLNSVCSIGLWQRHYTNLEPSCIMSCQCEENPNCLYKQLKRKEQECEGLKKEQSEIKKYLGISYKTILERLEELTDFRDKDREQLDQLQAENNELEGKLNFIKYLIKKALDPDKTSCEESFENLYKCLDIIDKTKDGE